MLIDRVIRAKNGSQEDTLALVEKFTPFLRKYGAKLSREDGQEEMTLAFLQVLADLDPTHLNCHEDGAVVNYLVKSVYHAYCQLQAETFRQPVIAFSIDNTEEQEREVVLAKAGPQEDRSFFLLLQDCSALTRKEREVLTLIYYAGYSATEIAASYGTSKQNINQIKRRGQKKLEKMLKEKKV